VASDFTVLDTGSARCLARTSVSDKIRKDSQTKVAVRDRYTEKTALQCEGICAGMKTDDITVMVRLDICFESAEGDGPTRVEAVTESVAFGELTRAAAEELVDAYYDRIFVLMRAMGAPGIALATTIGISLHFFGMTWFLRRRLHGLEGGKVMRTVGRTMVAAAVMGFSVDEVELMELGERGRLKLRTLVTVTAEAIRVATGAAVTA